MHVIFLDSEADPEDAIACGFLPAGKSGKYPNLNDLLGDLIDEKIATILRSRKFESGIFQTGAYPRPCANETAKKAAFRTILVFWS